MAKGTRAPVIDGLKRCPQCGLNKPLDGYYADRKNQYGVRSPCKECIKRSSKARYEQEGSSGKKNNKVRLAARAELKRQLVAAAGGKCTRCGYKEFISGLDFHHVHGDKEATIANLLLRAISKRGDGLDFALKEAKKCILLCRNCHSALHAGEWEQEEIEKSIEEES